jgi:KipI family sensor histidine kinase inhibitor
MTSGALPRLVAAGDSVLIAELEPVLDEGVNRRAAALGERIRTLGLAGVKDVVVTANAVALYFDPLAADRGAMEAALTEPVTIAPTAASVPTVRQVEVRYGGDEGPDMMDLARALGMGPDEIVRRHTGATYRVFMLGFMPGFAYLGALDTRLQVARRRVPRVEVPAGSVAVAGPYTAIYPLNTPGGWHIIGRTELRPFDLAREPACLFQVGDLVRFNAATA